MNQKKGLDYFPFDVDFFQDEKLQFISARFGLKGEAVAVRLLCKVYRQGYYLAWDEDMALLFAKSVGDGCQHSLVNDVVSELLKRGFFNKSIFERFSILTSKGIQRRYFEASSRRKNVEYDQRFLLIDLSKYKNVITFNENADISNENANILKQSKVKESKVKESRGKENGNLKTKGSDDIASLFQTFERCGFQINGHTRDRLLEFAKDYPGDWVEAALKRSADRGKKTLGYVKGILNNWQIAGAMDDGKPQEKDRSRSKAYMPEPNVPKKYVAPEPKQEPSGMPEELRKKINQIF